MSANRNILLPTDFSDNAWNATQYALSLYKGKPCNFHFLNTYTPAIVHSRFMATTAYGGAVEDNVRNCSEAGLEKLRQEIISGGADPAHEFHTYSSFNILSEEVKELVAEKSIDLVVTGTKGASGLDEIFLGSNTVRIIKSVRQCPVLVVPEDFTYRKPARIAFATGFKRSFRPDIIQPLLDLAKNLEAAIHVVHIDEKELDKYQETNKELLAELLSPVAHRFHGIPYFTSKSDVIQYFLNEFEMDMLALVNYKHGFLEELVREPVVKRVAFHTQIPLLVLPE